MDYSKLIKTGCHLFIGATGVYIKLNTTPGGRAATGRLGKTLWYFAKNSGKIFRSR